MVDATSRQTDNTQRAGAAGDDARTRASEAMLRDANQPGSSKAQKMNDVQNLAGTIVDSAMAQNKSKPEATQIMYKALLATTNEQRAKVFSDNGLTEPTIVKTLEGKYKGNFPSVIRQAVEDIKAGQAPASATRVADTQTDRTTPVAPAVAPTADINTRVNDGWTKVGAAVHEVSNVKADGQPLPDSSRAVFENALKAANNLDPKALEQEKLRLLNSIPNWSQPLEQQYTNLTNNFDTAQAKLSPAVETKMQSMGNASSDARLSTLVQMAKTDTTAKDYVQSLANLQQFAEQNPSAATRQKLQPTFDRMTSLEHGTAVAEGAYSQALLKTGNPGDFQQAIQHFNNAAKDDSVGLYLPSLKDTLTQLKAGEAALQQAQGTAQAAPAQSGDLSAQVPGLKQLQAADSIMTDPSKNASDSDKFNQAKPLYEAALAAAKAMPVDQLDSEKTAIDGKIAAAFKESKTNIGLTTAADVNEVLKSDKAKTFIDMVQKDPALAAKLGPLLDANTVNEAKRGQLLRVSEDYAQAMSKAAFDLGRQANANPAQFNNFTTQAAQLNEKAVQVLKDVGASDANFGVSLGKTSAAENSQIAALNGKRIDAEIKQLQGGEPLDVNKASGAANMQTAAETVDAAVNGQSYLRPLKLATNVFTDMVGKGSEYLPSSVGTVVRMATNVQFPGIGSPDATLPSAVASVTAAKEADPVGAKAEIAKHEHDKLAGSVSMVGDIVAGQAGRIAAEHAPSMLSAAAKLLPETAETAIKGLVEAPGWRGKVAAAVIVGGGVAFGAKWAQDDLSHYALGTEKMSIGELATHSAAGLASAYVAKGMTDKLPGMTGNVFRKYGETALAGAATNATLGFGEVNPWSTNKATGKTYSVTDTLFHTGVNAAEGATGAVAARLVAPALKFGLTAIPGAVTKIGGGTLGWLANSKAGLGALPEAIDAAIPAAAKPAPGAVSELFYGSGVKSALTRHAAGTAVGAAGSLYFVNPWKTDSATGDKYTWGQSLALAGEVGTAVGVGTNALAYPAIGAKAGYNALGRALPGEGSTLAKTMGQNLTATSLRFGIGGTVGFGGSLMAGESWSDSTKHGLEWGTAAAATPFIIGKAADLAKPVTAPVADFVNAGRRGLGQAAERVGERLSTGADKVAGTDTFLGRTVVTPAKGVAALGGQGVDAVQPIINKTVIPFGQPLSTAGNGLLEASEWRKIDKLSDEQVQADAAEAARQEAAQKQQQQSPQQ